MRFFFEKYPLSIDFLQESWYTDSMKEIDLATSETLEDMQMDGLKIVQDKNLYRFTSDSVLLSKFARAKNGDNAADFCAGSGIVAFHFYALNKAEKTGLTFTLFELQSPLLNLAKKTAAYNGFTNFAFVEGRLQDVAEEYRERFSLVLCNPPYEKGGFDNETYEKAICRKEITLTLEEIAKAAAFALKYGGRIAMLHRADRVAEVCCALRAVNIEVKRMQFVTGRAGAKPYLVMVEGVKGGKPSCEVIPTLINMRAL